MDTISRRAIWICACIWFGGLGFSALSAQELNQDAQDMVRQLQVIEARHNRFAQYVATLIEIDDSTEKGREQRIDARVKLRLLQAEIQDLDNYLYQHHGWISEDRRAWHDYLRQSTVAIRAASTKREYFAARRQDSIQYKAFLDNYTKPTQRSASVLSGPDSEYLLTILDKEKVLKITHAEKIEHDIDIPPSGNAETTEDKIVRLQFELEQRRRDLGIDR